MYEHYSHKAQLPALSVNKQYEGGIFERKRISKWTFGSQLYLNEKRTLGFEMQCAI